MLGFVIDGELIIAVVSDPQHSRPNCSKQLSAWHQNKWHQIRSLHGSDAANNSSEDMHLLFAKLDGENSGVAELTFNRSKAANAMGRQMLSELRSTIAYLTNHKTEVRCVVLISSSNKAFSAGADL